MNIISGIIEVGNVVITDSEKWKYYRIKEIKDGVIGLIPISLEEYELENED